MKPYELKVRFDDGKEKTYKLCLGNKALYFLEDEFGLTIRELFTKLKEDLSIKKFTLIILASLKKYHPDITLEEVHDIIDAVGYEKISEVVRHLFESQFQTAPASKSSTKKR